MKNNELKKLTKEIGRIPTECEIKCILQYGRTKDCKCLNCGKLTWYFNQCDKCNTEMIQHAKSMY